LARAASAIAANAPDSPVDRAGGCRPGSAESHGAIYSARPVSDQAGSRQDHHLPDHRHEPRFHRQLYRAWRARDGGRSVGVALVAGPLFYLAHETAWNYFCDAEKRVDLTVLVSQRPEGEETPDTRRGFTISRALAKTITYRTIATAVDFTTNFVVVGDLATAAALSASGFILGPFVYLGHEMVWDRYGSPTLRAPDLPALPKLLGARGQTHTQEDYKEEDYTVESTENVSPA
jgi:uncharacterized membrane protein